MQVPVRSLQKAPPHLVENNKMNFGTYCTPFQDVNCLDATIGHIFPWPRMVKSFRLKEWQHFAIVEGDLYISLALFNAKTMALVQVCVANLKDKTIIDYEKRVLPFDVIIPETLYDSQAYYNHDGFQLKIFNQLEQGQHRIDLYIQGDGKHPTVEAQWFCHEDVTTMQPIIACMPFDDQRGAYTHKCITPVSGFVTIDEQTTTFKEQSSYSLIDIHKGFYPYEMQWHWATGGGYLNDGRLFGLNLCKNQAIQPEQYNENCIWVDGKLHLLPTVRFLFHKNDQERSWVIRDTYGNVDISFRPIVWRTLDVNAVIIRSKYRAPYGIFDGYFKNQDGEEFEVNNLVGMCEDFYLRT